MSERILQETVGTVSTPFYRRLAADHDDLRRTVTELAQHIDGQNLRGVLDVLSALGDRIREMRDISIVFDGYLDSYEQLMKSLNHDPKEGL